MSAPSSLDLGCGCDVLLVCLCPQLCYSSEEVSAASRKSGYSDMSSLRPFRSGWSLLRTSLVLDFMTSFPIASFMSTWTSPTNWMMGGPSLRQAHTPADCSGRDPRLCLLLYRTLHLLLHRINLHFLVHRILTRFLQYSPRMLFVMGRLLLFSFLGSWSQPGGGE